MASWVRGASPGLKVTRITDWGAGLPSRVTGVYGVVPKVQAVALPMLRFGASHAEVALFEQGCGLGPQTNDVPLVKVYRRVTAHHLLSCVNE